MLPIETSCLYRHDTVGIDTGQFTTAILIAAAAAAAAAVGLHPVALLVVAGAAAVVVVLLVVVAGGNGDKMPCPLVHELGRRRRGPDDWGNDRRLEEEKIRRTRHPDDSEHNQNSRVFYR